MKYFTIVCIVVITALFLVSCTGRNAQPYPAERITALLDEKYGAEGRFEYLEAVSASPAPYARNEYLFFDREREVRFVAYSMVRTNFWGSFGSRRDWGDKLNKAIMYSKRDEAAALAARHGLKLLPVENIDWAGTTVADYVYVTDGSQLEDAAKLAFELHALYGLEQPDDFTEIRFLYPRAGSADAIASRTMENMIGIESIAFRDLSGDGALDEAGVLQALTRGWERFVTPEIARQGTA